MIDVKNINLLKLVFDNLRMCAEKCVFFFGNEKGKPFDIGLSHCKMSKIKGGFCVIN